MQKLDPSKLFSAPLSQCPICGSSRLESKLKLYYWRENLLNFSDCIECGLNFANPMPTDALITLGNTALVNHYHQNRTFEHEFRDARQAYLKGKIFSRKLNRWKPKGRILEIGCYQGFFSLGIKDNSTWEVETLEIAPELAKFVREKLNIPCHQGTLEELELPEGTFDFIVFHDLIEHVNQPLLFLEKVNRLLRPKGRIQILTPNTIQDFAFNRRAYAAGTPTTILLNHLMNFSPKALRIALEKTGFESLSLYCFGIKHALKDFGWFGMGQPQNIPPGPSMENALALECHSLLNSWDEIALHSLRNHPKTSWNYAWLKEILPSLFSPKVPAQWGIGHEIFALAQKN